MLLPSLREKSKQKEIEKANEGEGEKGDNYRKKREKISWLVWNKCVFKFLKISQDFLDSLHYFFITNQLCVVVVVVFS